MIFRVESVLIGQAVPLIPGELSAIAKFAVADRRAVGFLGIDGDQQADLSVHGGPDKAIHHYPRDHYAFWQGRERAAPVLDMPGAFGENISTCSLTEDMACIGDRYRLGTALVEIAQGRQPCWKQAHRLDDPSVLATMVKTGRCGWYYRVIETGSVATGDDLALVDRPYPAWTVARVIDLLIAGGGKRDRASLCGLAMLDVLAAGWRQRAAAMATR